MKFGIDTPNIDDVSRRLEITTRLAEQALAQTAQEMFEIIEQRVSGHRVTGDLEASLELNRNSPDSYTIGHNAQRAPHAVFVHWGTRPHRIEPKDKSALRWPGGNGFIFAKWVEHPGYEGDPYLVDTADQAPLIFQRKVEHLLEQEK